jgi:hypothetical protein
VATVDHLRRWEIDEWVAAASVVVLVGVVSLLVADLRRAPKRTPPPVPVAKLAAVFGAVSWRGAGTLAWEPAESQQPLAAGDAVFVQPGGAAQLTFATGAVVQAEERTLVVVEPPAPQEDRLRVLEGSVLATAGGSALGLRSRGAEAVLSPGGAASADGGGRLELLEGKARIGAEERAAAPAVRLLAPARGHRLYAAAFPVSIELRWEGDAAREDLVEVSRERTFERNVASGPGAAGTLDVQVDHAGPLYWRLTDARGRPRSETRKLTAILDLPPRAYSPQPGEIVLSPLGIHTPFWWTPVDGAQRYRVEVAHDDTFRRIALSEQANGPGLWASLDLPEGIYHWRVRAERQGAEEPAPPSPAVPFRLIHRPVLDAPDLFDPSIEGAAHAH